MKSSSPVVLVVRKNQQQNESNPSSNPDTITINDEDNCLKKNPKKTTTDHFSFAVVRHPVVQFVVCAAGINICYLYFGIVQERIYLSIGTLPITATTKSSHHITAFLLLLQAISNAIAAAVANRFFYKTINTTPTTTTKQATNRKGLPLHHRLLLLTSFSYSLAMTSSNEALNHVSYPIASLAKSCKVVPSMIAEFCLQGHANHFKYQDIVGALCFIVGILFFQYCSTTNTTHPNLNNRNANYIIGLSLLFLSLAMDGLLSYCQGLLKQSGTTTKYNTTTQNKYKNKNTNFRAPTSVETMLWTNIYSIAFFLPYAIITGQLVNGIELLQLQTTKDNTTTPLVLTNSTVNTTLRLVRHDMFLLSICAAVGQFFIFSTIQIFSPIMCTTITTTRKFLSILTSVFKYGHVLSFGQWSSVGLVFFGLYAQIFAQLFSSGEKIKQY